MFSFSPLYMEPLKVAVHALCDMLLGRRGKKKKNLLGWGEIRKSFGTAVSAARWLTASIYTVAVAGVLGA